MKSARRLALAPPSVILLVPGFMLASRPYVLGGDR